MPTEMLYLDDTYLFGANAIIRRATLLEDGTTDVEFDRTVFYPQGGGQPCDHGIIATSTGRATISKVSLDAEGIIHHVGTLEGKVETEQSANLAIDPERRTLNARNHSAGHLIDIAVTESGLPGLRVVK
jgi:Ser-tRNA(Ala) deacylase AlaX